MGGHSMKSIIVNIYTFDELTDEAKEVARNWYRESRLDSAWAWESTQEDAVQIGLEILALDCHKANEGQFIASAEECAHKIIDNHGESCETYTTAKTYLADRDRTIDESPRNEDGEFENTYELDQNLDKLDREFLYSLLKDYRIMFEKELDYMNSDEYVDENILANEYTFTINGKREG
jgi:hypothetical protein